MAADTCEACGLGTVSMDSVYGIMACDNCGRVFDDVETYLGAHHQAGHVMERGGTFVKSTETGALAACGLGGSSLFRSANREEVNKVRCGKPAITSIGGFFGVSFAHLCFWILVVLVVRC